GSLEFETITSAGSRCSISSCCFAGGSILHKSHPATCIDLAGRHKTGVCGERSALLAARGGNGSPPDCRSRQGFESVLFARWTVGGVLVEFAGSSTEENRGHRRGPDHNQQSRPAIWRDLGR